MGHNPLQYSDLLELRREARHFWNQRVSDYFSYCRLADDMVRLIGWTCFYRGIAARTLGWLRRSHTIYHRLEVAR